MPLLNPTSHPTRDPQGTNPDPYFKEHVVLRVMTTAEPGDEWHSDAIDKALTTKERAGWSGEGVDTLYRSLSCWADHGSKLFTSHSGTSIASVPKLAREHA